ncbi:MAG: hypothetical protein KC656_04680 [Myxococcales bacterium]|nr:hypothetical protein [Myxococcales bacterium]MCB9668441.1 hypothetical protein [Alphaproteobacteria bacterium]MCB9690679.1 hypothetical protein [Alphaproteobacteria bacterium]
MVLLLLSVASACERWAQLTALAPLSAPGLDESSGVAPSRITRNQLWTHDDSGTPELFRFGIDGTYTVHEVPGAANEDWEDIASAPCGGREACLYVADIGAERPDPTSLQVYVVVEPDGDGPARLRERWELRWPGTPRDAETLLVDPCTQEAWIVTRGETTEVFAVDPTRGPSATDLLPVTSLPVGPITGGDFAPDGTGVVLRTQDAIWLWRKDPEAGVDWEEAPLLVADGLEPGEAITWEADGDLVLTSEGAPTAVGRLACELPSLEPQCTAGGCGCALSPASGPLPWAWLGLAGVGWGAVRRRASRTSSRPPSAPRSPARAP